MCSMKHRLLSTFILIALLCPLSAFGAKPQVYMVSLFANESITSTESYGGRITLGFEGKVLHGGVSVRSQGLKTNLSVFLTKPLHGKDSACEGIVFGNLDYFSYGLDNGATSLIYAYAVRTSTPFKQFPTFTYASIGVHGTSTWSKYYDASLLLLAPYVAISATQGFFDRLYANLFITTDTLCLNGSEYSFCYGGSVSLSITDNMMVVVRPLVRFSDFFTESRFITMTEVSCSILWTDTSSKKHTLQQLGVWL